MRSFRVDKPADFLSSFRKMQEHVKKRKDDDIRLEGDENRGTLYAYGVVGDFVTGQDHIEIIIRKKPALLPQRMIENEIKKMFQQLK